MPSPILTENFDSYTNGNLNGQNNWAGDVAYQIQGTTVQAGAKAASVTTAGSEIQMKQNTNGVAQNSGDQIFYMRAAQTNVEGDVIFLDGSDNQCMKVGFQSDGTLTYNDQAGAHVILTYGANQWYKIELQWSSTDHKFRAIVNDGIPSPFGFGMSEGSAVHVEAAKEVWFDCRGTGTFYFDSFSVGSSGNMFSVM